MGGASFLSGGCPWGASVLVGGGVFEKYRKMAGGTPTMGNPACGHYFVQCRFMSLYFLPLWICNFPLSLFNKSPFFVKLITQSYSILLILLLNLFLFLSTFSVFLNEYFFRWLACKSSQQIFSVNKLYYAILQYFFCIQLFPKFFRIEVF